MKLALLLLLVPLMTLPASALKPKLLDVGSRPPLFTALTADGRRLDMRAILGKKRVVLVFGPSFTFLQSVQDDAAKFEERDLMVLARKWDAAKTPTLALERPPTYFFVDRKGRIATLYKAADKPAFYLVGKDGLIKMASSTPPTNAELFATIDAMPMRQQEMRGRK